MHQTKPDFKKMTETQRKEFLKEFKKSVASRKEAGGDKKKKPVKYLEFNKTSRPVPMETINDSAMETSMKKYREHINSMVVLGFSNPSDPSFRNDVMKNMKELYNANPKNILPMHNKEWVVNSIIQKVYQNAEKSKAKEPNTSKKTTVKTQDVKKTKQMFEARRKALAAKKRKQPVVAANSNGNTNNNHNGFNMNNMSNNENGKSNNNNNKNGRNSNNNNNVRSMTNDDVKKLMNNLKRLNMSVVRV